VKWPNDVLLDGRKVAGVLVEGRPQEGWAVVGIGVNAAFAPDELPPELNAGTLGRRRDELEATLDELLGHLGTRLAEPADETLAALRTRDALLDRPLSWPGGEGVGAGIDAGGRLRVRGTGGELVLDAGEVHLGRTSTAAG
jgi:BirA family biotin operon repressor/biotin-[acetyl-CoA-carboxylase] ligase